ncbi:MAG TPA: hypothetical protein VMT85_03255 [Thermoanaerobaculia bacterium]|nr:hypothetical protein [Thermoanaerobaculia bacterium]
MSEPRRNTDAQTQSWILELRARLGSEREERPAQEGVALFIGLFVEEGQLWLPFVEDLAEHLADEDPGGTHLALPAADMDAGADPWSGAARAAVDALGVEPAAVLRIGRLAPHWPDPALGLESAFYPCVAAIPPPDPPAVPLGEGTALVRLPLLALASPHRAERREIQIEDRRVEVDVVHASGHILWGPTVAVLDDLIARLGLGN